MGAADDPGHAKVSDATRACERRDGAVHAGAGRGPTSDEAAAAERAGPVTDRTREAYRSYVFRAALVRGSGRI